MDSVGSAEWFWNLEDTTDPIGSIAFLAEEDGVDKLKAISHVLELIVQREWDKYISDEVALDVVESIVENFVTNHAKVPYVGRSIFTRDPICILTGASDGVEARVAYWENCAIFGSKVQLLDGTTSSIYAFTVNPQDRALFKYPAPKDVLEEAEQ